MCDILEESLIVAAINAAGSSDQGSVADMPWPPCSSDSGPPPLGHVDRPDGPVGVGSASSGSGPEQAPDPLSAAEKAIRAREFRMLWFTGVDDPHPDLGQVPHGPFAACFVQSAYLNPEKVLYDSARDEVVDALVTDYLRLTSIQELGTNPNPHYTNPAPSPPPLSLRRYYGRCRIAGWMGDGEGDENGVGVWGDWGGSRAQGSHELYGGAGTPQALPLDAVREGAYVA
jgi:hypothetical protein